MVSCKQPPMIICLQQHHHSIDPQQEERTFRTLQLGSLLAHSHPRRRRPLLCFSFLHAHSLYSQLLTPFTASPATVNPVSPSRPLHRSVLSCSDPEYPPPLTPPQPLTLSPTSTEQHACWPMPSDHTAVHRAHVAAGHLIEPGTQRHGPGYNPPRRPNRTPRSSSLACARPHPRSYVSTRSHPWRHAQRRLSLCSPATRNGLAGWRLATG